MEKADFDKLLLKTAFCCVACDGNLDKKEIAMLKSLFENNPMYKDINFDEKINSFIKLYNEKGKAFFTFYFEALSGSILNEQEELAIVDIALKTINADEKTEYSEIKFFKVIRKHLKVSDEKIRQIHGDIETFLEEDVIAQSLLEKITSQYLDVAELPQFDLVTNLESDLPDESAKNE